MSELLLIVLTCEPTLLVVEYWSSPTLLAGRAISISMGLMSAPFQMLCFVQLFVFQQIWETSHQLPSGIVILHLEQCGPDIFEGR